MMRLRQILPALFVLFAVAVSGFAPANASKVDITVNKAGQKMTVRVDGSIEYVWPVSTGAAQYDTPSGQYRPFRMEAEHFSKEWDDAPMPHSIFFTGQGHAIHGSFHVKSLGRRASHGCVRLSPQNAEILFDLVSEAGLANTSVEIKGGFFDTGPRLDGQARRSVPWFLRGASPKRSFSDVNNDIEKVTAARKLAADKRAKEQQAAKLATEKKLAERKAAREAARDKAKKDREAKIKARKKLVAQCKANPDKKECKGVSLLFASAAE